MRNKCLNVNDNRIKTEITSGRQTAERGVRAVESVEFSSSTISTSFITLCRVCCYQYTWYVFKIIFAPPGTWCSNHPFLYLIYSLFLRTHDALVGCFLR